jgi:hypothetical protein
LIISLRFQSESTFSIIGLPAPLATNPDIIDRLTITAELAPEVSCAVFLVVSLGVLETDLLVRLNVAGDLHILVIAAAGDNVRGE